jgi:hypothetical protein
VVQGPLFYFGGEQGLFRQVLVREGAKRDKLGPFLLMVPGPQLWLRGGYINEGAPRPFFSLFTLFKGVFFEMCCRCLHHPCLLSTREFRDDELSEFEWDYSPTPPQPRRSDSVVGGKVERLGVDDGASKGPEKCMCRLSPFRVWVLRRAGLFIIVGGVSSRLWSDG